MSDKINLEEIIDQYDIFDFVDTNHKYFKNQVIEAMKEACRQTLELAAENAIVNKSDCMIGCCPECGADGVDKQSILDVINLIE